MCGNPFFWSWAWGTRIRHGRNLISLPRSGARLGFESSKYGGVSGCIVYEKGYHSYNKAGRLARDPTGGRELQLGTRRWCCGSDFGARSRDGNRAIQLGSDPSRRTSSRRIPGVTLRHNVSIGRESLKGTTIPGSCAMSRRRPGIVSGPAWNRNVASFVERYPSRPRLVPMAKCCAVSRRWEDRGMGHVSNGLNPLPSNTQVDSWELCSGVP